MRLVEQFREMPWANKIRIILILLVAEFVLVFLSLGAITITTQPSVCNVCHEMRADIRAWKSSSHAEVTCYSCHSEGGVLAFVVGHLKESKEAYYHLTNSFEKPINGNGEYARKMSNEPCKRCHSLNRKVTPRKGIIIDHLKHQEKGITCVTCHNRTAHPNMKGYLGEKQPKETQVYQISFKIGKRQTAPIESRPYEDHIKMRFCMACHTGEKDKGPKECDTCHSPDFELKPEDHLFPEWLPSEEALQQAKALHGQKAKPTTRDCLSCHEQRFCTDCHRIEMPHPATWKKEHSETGKTSPQQCTSCHAQQNFCDACHHQYNPALGPWYDPRPGLSLHPDAVRKEGTADCFDCHNPVYCARCHVRGKVD